MRKRRTPVPPEIEARVLMAYHKLQKCDHALAIASACGRETVVAVREKHGLPRILPEKRLPKVNRGWKKKPPGWQMLKPEDCLCDTGIARIEERNGLLVKICNPGYAWGAEPQPSVGGTL